MAADKIIINSFRDQITVGCYDSLHVFAKNPEQIRGQTFHPVTNEPQLDHPKTNLTTKQVYDKYGDKMGSLSELLDYGAKHPNVQRKFPIAIVWKVGTQFWFAVLNKHGSGRELVVGQVRPEGKWHGRYRFLVRK